MNLKKLFIGIILAAGALAVSCEQEKPVFGISADQDVIEFPQGGGTAQVQVTTAQSWTVKIPSNAQDWLTADPASGTGSATITFTAAANDGKDRKTGLKINAGMAGYVSVTASQPGSVKPGDGLTAATAWSASEANAWIKANLADKQVTTDKYYIKGIIHKVQTTFAASGNYGNAVFFISDDGQAASDDFEAFQVYYLDGKQWKSGQPDVEVGDEVIIYGPVTLYGSTAETSGRGAAYIYSHLRNGVAPTPGSGGDDTDYSKAEAKTVAEFIAAADANNYYKLTGTVSGFNSNYCSFDLTDATGKIYVYSVLANYKTEWASKIKNGGTITIAGKYKLYNEKHEVVDAAILSFEGGSDQPAGETKVVTIAEFNAAAESETQKYQLTGTIGGSINAQYGNFDLTDDTGTVYVYGLTATELAYGTKNDQSFGSLNLGDGDKITIIGYRGSYNGKIEVVYAYFKEKLSGGSGGGGSQTDYSQSPAKTVAEFLALADTENYYKLSGTVSSFNSTYCSFDLTDASGKVYVYSVLSSYKSQWSSKVKDGGTITIAGKYKLYNGTPEVVDAAILAFEGGESGGGSGSGSDEGALVFQFSDLTGLSGWPTKADEAKQASTQVYKLDGVDYTFSLSPNIYTSTYSGASYLMLASKTNAGPVYLGLPAIAGKKLVEVKVTTSSGASTNACGQITSDTNGTVVSGGDKQKLGTKSADFSWTLSGTAANTVYYYSSTESGYNSQIVKLALKYE